MWDETAVPLLWAAEDASPEKVPGWPLVEAEAAEPAGLSGGPLVTQCVARALYPLHYATRSGVPHRPTFAEDDGRGEGQLKLWSKASGFRARRTLQESAHLRPVNHFSFERVRAKTLPQHPHRSPNRSPQRLHCFSSVCWRGKRHVSTTFVARQRGCILLCVIPVLWHTHT